MLPAKPGNPSNPQDPRGGRREPTPTNCSLISTLAEGDPPPAYKNNKYNLKHLYIERGKLTEAPRLCNQHKSDCLLQFQDFHRIPTVHVKLMECSVEGCETSPGLLGGRGQTP